MERIVEVPEAVRDYQRMGGVLEFVAFAGVDDVVEAARGAIGQALDHVWGVPGGIHRDVLPRLAARVLTRGAFLGDWADPATGLLRRVGSYGMSDGTRLENPLYWTLDVLAAAGVTVRSGGGPIPELWEGGQFAFAFADPPYRLRGTPGEVAAAFEAVCAEILPPGRTCTILDWGSPALPDLCPGYFEPGTEWWGAFLFTVHVAEEGRVTVILGAATD